jgi:unsaturated rhamnogalacturonyl hydrolase
MLVALQRLSQHTGKKKYIDFTCKNLDQYVKADGSILTFKLADFNLDNISPGRALLSAYEATGVDKYRAAADTLREQLRRQPRTKEGGFWHKNIYPNQMWLDGLFMAAPFYAAYARTFHEEGAFDDIAHQFIAIARHTRDPVTGLFYHAWDESKQQRWADPQTGRSPCFWGRAMGWYAMALVDVLDFFPADHPKRAELVAILQDLSRAVLAFRNEKTHLWYQVVDQHEREGNYFETSASCMFAYCFAKGVAGGYLSPGYRAAAEETFRGVIEQKVTIDRHGYVDLHGTCRGAGLGGIPYRDGSFAYYVGEPQRTNDMKGVGPFLLAAIALEAEASSTAGGVR